MHQISKLVIQIYIFLQCATIFKGRVKNNGIAKIPLRKYTHHHAHLKWLLEKVQTEIATLFSVCIVCLQRQAQTKDKMMFTWI